MADAPLVQQIQPETEADPALIGGKAASLATLAQLGARVPPAFVLTTEAYRRWAANDDEALVGRLVDEGLEALEARAGCQLGLGAEGLVVSVRSGAPVSMPGMMDTVLNAGLGQLGPGLDASYYEARGSFLFQFAELVAGLDDDTVARLRSKTGGGVRDHAALAALELDFAEAAAQAGAVWPDTPRDELVAAAKAVFGSWNSKRAKMYRRMRKIDDSLGTSVTIQQMVFGNRDAHSGSGVSFTRNPTNGEPGMRGEFLAGGQGEDVVAGRETGTDLDGLRAQQPDAFTELTELGQRLEQTFRKVYEIEFTLEQGQLYILQCRPALLTARAASRVAVAMVEEGLIDRSQALDYAREHGFEGADDRSALAVNEDATAIAHGLAVGGGTGTGRAAFTSAAADELIAAGTPAVLIATNTSPDLFPVMQKIAGLITMRGGESSHAAVVARQVGMPCVVGMGERIEADRLLVGEGIASGDWVTVDGDTGQLFAGDVTTTITPELTPFEQTLCDWSAATACTRTDRRN